MKAIYRRYGKTDFEEFGAIDEAQSFLSEKEDSGEIFALGVYDERSYTFFVNESSNAVQSPEELKQEILEAIKKIGIKPKHIQSFPDSSISQ